MKGEAVLVDSAPWSKVVQKLQHGLCTPVLLSKYASETERLANTAVVPEGRLKSIFRQRDALGLEEEELASILGERPVLVTLNFTLNELFTAGGIAKTTQFLLKLTSCIPNGSLLLVVDSPGSYSETMVGKQSKKYPMQWLLHKILSGTEGTVWTLLETDDSVWFRLSEDLDYPIPLENMRFQLHLYRASAPPANSDNTAE